MKNPRAQILLTAPSFLWMLVLFAWPAANLFLMAFKPPDVTGGVGEGWTLDAWRVFGEQGYFAILWRTVWITALTTLICILVALPVAWCISRAARKWQPWLLLLVVLPFWTSFLVRVYAWRVLLAGTGPVASILKTAGVISEDTITFRRWYWSWCIWNCRWPCCPSMQQWKSLTQP